METAQVVLLPTAARRHTTHLFSSVQNASFDVHAYSRMKFGSGADARLLGYEMAEAFAAEFWNMLCKERCVVIPAPSTSVPVAATLMGWHFHNRLNHLLDSTGHMPVQWNLVDRAVTYNDNYAQLGLEERRKLLADDERHVNVSFCTGKTLIFVDDVRITGTHEEKLSHMVHALGMNNPVVFATYAAYSGENPAIEHELNHQYVHTGLDVVALTQRPMCDWRVTTRAMRLVLELPAEKFGLALRVLSLAHREEIYHAAIAKGYSKHAPYNANFESLRHSIERPEVLPGGLPL